VQGLSSKTQESSSAKRPVKEDNRCRTIAPYSPDRRFWFAANLERNAARVRLVQAADVITLTGPLPMRFEELPSKGP